MEAISVQQTLPDTLIGTRGIKTSTRQSEFSGKSSKFVGEMHKVEENSSPREIEEGMVYFNLKHECKGGWVWRRGMKSISEI